MDIRLNVRLNARNFEELLENVAGDISTGGVFLRTDNPRPVDTEVKLVMALETENQNIRVKGVVMRSTTHEESERTGAPAGMAIRFVEFGQGDDAVLARLLELHGKR